MNNARANILSKLHASIGDVDYEKLPQESSYAYASRSRQQQLAHFISQLESNHTQVIKTAASDIPTHISQQLKQRDISRLLYGKETHFSSLIEQVKDNDQQGNNSVQSSIDLVAYDFTIDGNKERLFNEMPASVTTSHSAIAATGTIVLWPTPQEPRTLSLVPPVHFVIVDAKQLFARFEQLINTQQWHNKLPTNIVLVSGPSKTADIQQTLAYGAHGPKELIVLLINSDEI
ncbi:lactate utilization protein [Psychrobium sp. 1_MG-2023]|uniref:LutC/YkgG family protein n=1 Tax=Psychrobium sp. 1_MG-2023 TaxID=3062624 RepID=UPI000C33A5C2|nr:lactate utilization protein [Psychrobium sp. 1_MG-2023]MDP2559671.1 lactate utilization protein [Psychrobium sp. 1_MG-2023]PKF59502.1 lactate utilization protein [Alteromonadales bacterium alter-6D02]